MNTLCAIHLPTPRPSPRDMRPLWRDLILKVRVADPLQCSCCKGIMKSVRKVIRREEFEKRRRLVGVFDGGEAVARRVSPPGGAGESNHGNYGASLAGDQGVDCRRSALAMPTARSSSGSCFHHSTPQCGRSIPDDEPDLDRFNRPRNPSNPDPDSFDQTPTWKPPEIQLDDERILVHE